MNSTLRLRNAALLLGILTASLSSEAVDFSQWDLIDTLAPGSLTGQTEDGLTWLGASQGGSAGTAFQQTSSTINSAPQPPGVNTNEVWSTQAAGLRANAVQMNLGGQVQWSKVSGYMGAEVSAGPNTGHILSSYFFGTSADSQGNGGNKAIELLWELEWKGGSAPNRTTNFAYVIFWNNGVGTTNTVFGGFDENGTRFGVYNEFALEVNYTNQTYTATHRWWNKDGNRFDNVFGGINVAPFAFANNAAIPGGFFSGGDDFQYFGITTTLINTGAGSVGNSRFEALTLQAVPEPSAAVLIIGAMGFLMWRRR